MCAAASCPSSAHSGSELAVTLLGKLLSFSVVLQAAAAATATLYLGRKAIRAFYTRPFTCYSYNNVDMPFFLVILGKVGAKVRDSVLLLI